jgi:putative ABC transport system substrate-binding protein
MIVRLRIRARALRQVGLLTGLLGSAPFLAGAGPEIVSVASVEAEPYRVAYQGFQEALGLSRSDVKIREHVLREGTSRDQLLADIRERPPALVLTLGSTATTFIQSQVKQVPVVFCMVLNPQASGLIQSMQSSGNNLTGASLDIPVKLQFETLQSVVPSARRVGVFYNPKETEKVVLPAVKVANALGLDLVTIAVTSQEEFQEMADSLAKRNLDAVWSVADSTVFSTTRSVEFLLRRTLDARIPFMGLSPAFVKAGALLALSVDYKDVGLQCGEQAALVLQGQAPAVVPIVVPRKVTLHINMNVARAIGVKIPPRVLEKAVVLK